MEITCWLIPGWVTPENVQAWIQHPPSAVAPGWGMAYRRNPATGEVETELWLWAQEAAPERGEGVEAPASGA